MKKMTSAVSLIGAAALLVGCSNSTKLSLSTSATATTAGLSAGTVAQPLRAGPGVNLTRVRVVIEQIRLDPVSDGGVSDGGSDGGVEDNFVAGPFLIDLSGAALDAAGLSQVFEVDAKAGDYRRLRFKIHKLGGSDTQFAGMAGLSMSIEGTFNGTAFTWTSSLDQEQEREGTFTIAADSTNNVTLAVDTANWFANGAGGISPIDAQDDGTLRSIVENNIKLSIDAFKDDDRNGRR